MSKPITPIASISSIAVAALTLVGCQSTPAVDDNQALNANETNESQARFDPDRTAVLIVKGMTCPFCTQNVDKRLEATPGVEAINIDLATGRVDVLLDPNAPATRSTLENAIATSGFTLDQIDIP